MWLGLLICLLAEGIDPRVAAEVSRLEGHRVTITRGGYTIDDVAGEGAPLIGVVRRRGRDLWLITATDRYRLSGPLARPRIAGPDYKVWIVGTISGERLHIKRIGILAPPGHFELKGAARTPR